MMKWKTLKEKDVSPSPWLPVYRHKVELPDGQTIDDFYVAKLKDAAMVLPITEDGNIVLVRQYKHGASEILTELPAGMMEDDEIPIEAAKRELEEETGLVSDEFEELGNLVSIPTKVEFKVYGFLAKNARFEKQQNLDPVEEIEIIEKTPKEVRDMVRTGELNCTDSIAFLSIANLMYPELFRDREDKLDFEDNNTIDK